jgi:hypothetical protein
LKYSKDSLAAAHCATEEAMRYKLGNVGFFGDGSVGATDGRVAVLIGPAFNKDTPETPHRLVLMDAATVRQIRNRMRQDKDRTEILDVAGTDDVRVVPPRSRGRMTYSTTDQGSFPKMVEVVARRPQAQATCILNVAIYAKLWAALAAAGVKHVKAEVSDGNPMFLTGTTREGQDILCAAMPMDGNDKSVVLSEWGQKLLNREVKPNA